MNTRDTLFVEGSNLMIAEFKATDLAKKFGTPLYIMDAKYIRDICNAFTSAMKSYGEGAVCYASKAFATIATTQLIQKHGLWFDSVSGGETYLLNKAGVDMSKVLLHGNNKTIEELSQAIDLGVGYIVIDSFDEIKNLECLLSQKNLTQNVLIRTNPGITAHTHISVQTSTPDSKFGFGFDNTANDAIRAVIKSEHLVYKGLHWHIGSQIYDNTSYELAIDKTFEFLKTLEDDDIKTEVLDIGGGYGIYYTEEDPMFTPKRYGYILKNICEKVKNCIEKTGVQKPFLIVEPGRSIVGEAGITLYNIGTIKNFPGIKKYIAVDGGMCDNPRYALYESKYSSIICQKANLPKDDLVTIVGKCCESGDIIAKDILIQKAEVGDTLAVFSTGAYNYSMSSNYNLNKIPPVILVEGNKAEYIVRPQTNEDLVRNNITVDWV